MTNKKNIVDRLRIPISDPDAISTPAAAPDWRPPKLHDNPNRWVNAERAEAADLIERLRADNAELEIGNRAYQRINAELNTDKAELVEALGRLCAVSPDHEPLAQADDWYNAQGVYAKNKEDEG